MPQLELTHKLKEIFQIDQADLDFGIYRILNSRSKEISDYLEQTLPKQVQAALGGAANGQIAQWKSDLSQAQKQAADLGIDPQNSPKVQDLQAKIAAAEQGGSDIAHSVYRHLLTFFSRYYESGDFISQRRYKGDTYAVPYSGEEVLLHWANKDQYYTKSGEYFGNYRFTLSDGRTVFFRLISADTARDNRKDNDAKRLFSLAVERTQEQTDADGETQLLHITPISQSEDGQTLTLLFEYKAFEKSAKQEKLLDADIEKITQNHTVQSHWQALFEPQPTEKNPKRTLLQKHLSRYTNTNSADYFIHKDLGGFLRRELDFYIKNEVMHLDDMQNADDFAAIERDFRLIQVLRRIALDVIAFLAQLENFQKKLWLKKKFVADCQYLITLDHLFSLKNAEPFFSQIAENDAQLTAWQQLFAVPKADAIQFLNAQKSAIGGGKTDLKSTTYKNFTHLTIDTSLYPASFCQTLISALSAQYGEFEQHINGTLIHSDNFQALNLLQEKYREKVKCIYIDPPYNTGEDGFPYKDNYKSSSWLSMFEDRLNLASRLLNSQGLLACHMDEHEHLGLEVLIKNCFGNGDLGKLIWDKRNPKGMVKGIASQHEYVHFATNNLKHLDKENALSRNKENAEAMIRKAEQLFKRESSLAEAQRKYREWLSQQSDLTGGEQAYNKLDEKGDVYRLVSMAAPDKPETRSHRPLIHPITNKPCPVPAKGWRFKDEAMERLLANGEVIFGDDETTQPQRKYFLKENLTEMLPSLYYMGGSDEDFFKNIEISFPNPKPLRTAKYFISAIGRNKNSVVLDYFGGSGTTAHAVINLNREDKGNRKYILVEQGEYFDTVLKPRVQKVIYSKAWKDGKPTTEDKAQTLQGVSQIVKVLKLESYEDTLNNLSLQKPDLFNTLPESAQQDYLLNYLLNVESRGSLLNISHFAKPFDYRLNIATDSAGAYRSQPIDLVETFHYLIGADVLYIDDNRDSQGYVAIHCRLPTQHSDDKTLIFWRDCERISYDALQTLFEKLRINPADSEFSQVFINGDHTLDAVWDGEQAGQLKILSIEDVFLAKMFEGGV